MSTTDIIVAALTSQIARFPGAAVAVVNGAYSTTGLRGQLTGQSELAPAGQMGPQDGTVRCVASEIGTVALGREITVAGRAVTVTSVAEDSLGATVLITYRHSRPVAGV